MLGATTTRILALLLAPLLAAGAYSVEECCRSAVETGPCIIYTDMEPAYARGDAIVQNSPQWTNCSDFGVTTRGNLRPVSYAIQPGDSLPPDLVFDNTTGVISGTPQAYTLVRNRLSIVIAATDSNGNVGQSVPVVLQVGPREKPKSISFSDSNARALVWNGTLTITPPTDGEANFTHYMTYFTRTANKHDFNQFLSNSLATNNGTVLSEPAFECLLVIRAAGGGGPRCPGPFEFPGEGEVFARFDYLFNPKYLAVTTGYKDPSTGGILLGANYVSIPLLDAIDYLPMATGITFTDVDPGYQRYAGTVTINVPFPPINVTTYALFLIGQNTITQPYTDRVKAINKNLGNGGATGGVLTATLPADTIGAGYTGLAVYAIGTRAAAITPFVVNVTDLVASAPTIGAPSFSPANNFNLATGDNFTIAFPSNVPLGSASLTLIFAGGAASTVLTPVFSNDAHTATFTYVVGANDVAGQLSYTFTAADELSRSTSVPQTATSYNIVARISFASASVASFSYQPFTVSLNSSKTLSATLCSSVIASIGSASVTALPFTAGGNTFSCQVTPSAAGDIKLDFRSNATAGVVAGNSLTVPYGIPVVGSGVPTLIMVPAGTSSVTLPAPIVDSGLPWLARLTYSWAVTSVSPNTLPTAVIANAASAATQLNGIPVGATTTVTITITDPAVSATSPGAVKTIAILVDSPGFVGPVTPTATFPDVVNAAAVASTSNESFTVATPACLAGRVCTLQFGFSGLLVPSPSPAAAINITLYSDADADGVVPIGSLSIKGTSSIGALNWTVPTQGSAGAVAIIAVASYRDPITNDLVYVQSQRSGVTVSTADYTWTVGAWSACSKTCDAGVSTRSIACVSVATGGLVTPSSLCSTAAPVTVQPCLARACTTPVWRVSAPGTCSLSCGGGSASVSVQCVDSAGGIVGDNQCPSPKPASFVACNPDPCPAFRVHTSRSSCSATCGTGVVTVVRSCVEDGTGRVGDLAVDCQSSLADVSTEACSALPACPTDVTFVRGQPGTCTAQCGGGSYTRSDACLNASTNAAVSIGLCAGYGAGSSVTFTGSCADWPCVTNASAIWRVVPGDGCDFGSSAVGPGACGSALFGTQASNVTCTNPVTQAALSASVCAATSGYTPSANAVCKSVSSAEDCVPSGTLPPGSKCPNDCSLHGKCIDGVCSCFGAYTGEACAFLSSCNGMPYNNGDSCCEGVLTTGTSQSCCEGAHATLDRDGRCCASGVLDACGVCDGAGVGVDVLGHCCIPPSVIDASGVCCPASVGVDVCGVCGGSGQSCGTAADVKFTLAPGAQPCSQYSTVGTPGFLAYQQTIASTLTSALLPRQYTVTVSAISCVNATTGPLVASVGLVPVAGTVSQFMDPAALAAILGASAGSGAWFAGIIATDSLAVCGNRACESGERCSIAGLSQCCPADCPYVANTCPTSRTFLPALVATYGNVSGLAAQCSGRGNCHVDARGGAVCECYAGYVGADCSFCADGFTKSTSGTFCQAAVNPNAANLAPASHSLHNVAIGAISLLVVGIVVAVGFVVYRVMRKRSDARKAAGAGNGNVPFTNIA